MEGITALGAIGKNCGVSRWGLFQLTLLLATTASMRAQDQAAKATRDPGYWMFSVTEGASVVTGDTSQTTTTGAVVGMGIVHHVSGRWSYPFDIIGSFNGTPDSVAKQINTSAAETDFLTLTVDPTFDLVQGRRWGLYATGGGGFSWKHVIACSDVDCVSQYGVASSFRPALDGGLGVTFRVDHTGMWQVVEDTRYLDMFTPKNQSPGFNTAGTHLVAITFGFRFRFPARQSPASVPY